MIFEEPRSSSSEIKVYHTMKRVFLIYLKSLKPIKGINVEEKILPYRSFDEKLLNLNQRLIVLQILRERPSLDTKS